MTSRTGQCCIPAITTCFLQPLDVALLGPLKAQFRKLCAVGSAMDRVAAFLQETAGEPVERTRVDTWLSALKRRTTRVDIHERGWWALLQDAKRRSHGRPEGCVPRGARGLGWSSDADLEEDGGEQSAVLEVQPPTGCRCLKLFCSTSFWRRLPSEAPAAVAAAGPAKSGKGTKEASYFRLASAGLLRRLAALWSGV